MQQPVVTVATSNPTEVLEGENITLEWRYNLAGGRLLLLMRCTRAVPNRVIVQKLSNTLLIPDSRVQANVTDAFRPFRLLEFLETTTATISLKFKTMMYKIIP